MPLRINYLVVCWGVLPRFVKIEAFCPKAATLVLLCVIINILHQMQQVKF